jgi:hypothetical protein
LRLQETLGEPISLFSAFDVWRDRQQLIEVATSFRKQGVLLLDSGGYESSRICHHVGHDQIHLWDFAKYAEIAAEDIYDLVFSFDYFLEAREAPLAFAARIVNEFRNHGKILDLTKLIPVVHLQTVDGGRRLSDQEAIEVISEVVSNLKCAFIAVPERELGDGITIRVQRTRAIAALLKENKCALHILGCGNLLSFSLLAVAGAAMCDGLEWCRTLTADNFHLHHFQQKDVFADPMHHLGNGIAEFMVEQADINYKTAVAIRNLFSCQAFARSVHGRLQTRNVHEFIAQHFGQMAGDAIRTLEV